MEDGMEKNEETRQIGSVISAVAVTATPAQTFFTLAMKELESKKLLNDYKSNSKKAEELALNYINSEIHHPVISCFRELVKPDFTLILSSAELRSLSNNLEYGVICLGMLDYFAMALDNPLYSEDNKNLTRVFVANASKIFSEFKILFNRWSISASDAVRNRCEVVIAYLRHLEPKFAKIKDFDFKELLDSLLPGTTAQNGFISRSLPEPEGTLVNVAGKNEEEAADSTSQDSQERSVLMELKINTSIFEDTVDLYINKDRKTKSRIICNKLPSPPSQVTQVSQNQTPKTVVITKNRNSSGKQRMRPAPAILTRVLVPPPEIIDLDCEMEMPNTKMPRLELGTSRNKDKPVINAFAVLMNRSKEIALAEKLRRAGVPPN